MPAKKKLAPRVVPCDTRLLAFAGDSVIVRTDTAAPALFNALTPALRAARAACDPGEEPRVLPVPAVLAKHTPDDLFTDASQLLLVLGCIVGATGKDKLPAATVLPLAASYNALLFCDLIREANGRVEGTHNGRAVALAYGYKELPSAGKVFKGRT